jgi:CRISPR-associated protein Csb3
MNQSIALPGDVAVAFDHLAAYGAMAIAAASGLESVRIAWSDDLESQAIISGVTWEELAMAVRAHASSHARDNSWVMADQEIPPTWIPKANPKKSSVVSGLFSPRVIAMNSDGIAGWYNARLAELDRGTAELTDLDYAMIGALGIPSYWSPENAQDYGASRWEMKTRNRGEEFVRARLRRLAEAVAARPDPGVRNGLRGDDAVDEAGKNRYDSRTPTGLMSPKKTDNARAWCAMWGISLTRVIHHPRRPSATAAHIGRASAGYFCLPVMATFWPVGRLCTVLRSTHLQTAATENLTPTQAAANSLPAGSDVLTSWEWLTARGVSAVMRFPVHRTNNPNAPEKWLERGERLDPRSQR